MNRFAFTNARVQALVTPPAGKRSVHLDEKVPGLQVRVTATGAKTFSLLRRAKTGTLERLNIGRFPAMSAEAAQREAARLNLRIEAGENPAAIKRDQRAELTLGELWAEYDTRHLQRNGIRSANELRRLFGATLGSIEGDRLKNGRERKKSEGGEDWSRRKLSAIQPAQVERWHSALGEKAGRTVANRAHDLLRALYRWGIAKRLYSGESPCGTVERFPTNKRDRFLKGDELPRFFAALAECKNADLRDFVLMCLLTGARKSNVVSMRWAEVDLLTQAWTVPDAKSKNGEVMVVPLTSPAMEILHRRESTRPTGFVFPGKNEGAHLTTVKHSWETFRKAAGFADLRIHDLRRSMGSWQAITGASLAIIGKSLGHKDLQSTAIYARLSVDPVRDSMEKAAQAMLAAGTKKKVEVTPLRKRTTSKARA